MIVMIRNQKTQIATNTILRSLEYGHLEVCRKNFQEEGKGEISLKHIGRLEYCNVIL